MVSSLLFIGELTLKISAFDKIGMDPNNRDGPKKRDFCAFCAIAQNSSAYP